MVLHVNSTRGIIKSLSSEGRLVTAFVRDYIRTNSTSTWYVDSRSIKKPAVDSTSTEWPVLCSSSLLQQPCGWPTPSPSQRRFSSASCICCNGCAGMLMACAVRYSSSQRGFQTSASRRPDDDDHSREPGTGRLTQRQRLRLAVRDYGGTVVVFHVTISLASLGFFYLAVQSGLDVVGLLRWLGLGDSLAQSKVVAGGSTFVLAYAVHKVFAPARIATTLGCTPFIVRALRQRGILRTPKPRDD